MNSSPFDPSDFFGEEWKFQKPEPPQPKFQPGDKVICIETPDWPGIKFDFTSIPQAGRLYVVRSCCTNDVVCFVGIAGRPHPNNNGEIAFYAKHFMALREYREKLHSVRRLEAAFEETKAFWKKAATPDKPRRPLGNPKPKTGNPRKSR